MHVHVREFKGVISCIFFLNHFIFPLTTFETLVKVLCVIISFLMILFRSLPDPYNSSKQAVFCCRAFKTFV